MLYTYLHKYHSERNGVSQLKTTEWIVHKLFAFNFVMLSLVFELAELVFAYNTPKTKLTETERNFVVYFVHSGKTRPRAVISRFELKAEIHSAA